MKITIYELLGLVKDGKAPKEIKYDGTIYEYSENDDFYYWEGLSLYREFTTNGNCLDKEVEIIEEPKVITKESIEALGYACGEIRKCFENGWNKSLENKPLIEDSKKIEKLNDKLGLFGDGNTQKIINELNYTRTIINELIDEINNLKEND